MIERYGAEVVGGAERHCREVAERLAREYAVEVLTTCALHYDRWANHYLAGREELNGVTIERFPVAVERDPEGFAAFSDRTIAHRHHGALDELQWLLLQGPAAPELITAIRDRRNDYDLFVFWTYLYFPTYFGMPLVAEKAAFVPLGHDEPPFHLELFRPLYYLPRWIVYNSPAERELIEAKVGPAVAPGEIVGPGVDPPGPADGGRFRRTFGIADDFVLYVGRVNRSKGCHELVELFEQYKKRRPGRLKLLLVGNLEMTLPRRPDIRALGYLSEQEKLDALAAATLTVSASRYESFSMSLVESWMSGRASLVHAAAAPMRELTEASGGGLHYEDAASFGAALDRMLAQGDLRGRMAEAGRQYAGRHSWEAVHEGWLRAIEEALARVS